MAGVKAMTVLLLLVLCWEDLRHRAVHWSLFPLLLVMLAVPAYLGQSRSAWLANTGLNVLFLLGQFAAVSAWSALRYGRWSNLFRRELGVGDGLFLAVVAAGLSFERFVPYYVTGLVLCLLLQVTVLRWWPGQPRTVPTAGLLAAYLACWVALEQLHLTAPLHAGDQALDLWHG